DARAARAAQGRVSLSPAPALSPAAGRHARGSGGRRHPRSSFAMTPRQSFLEQFARTFERGAFVQLARQSGWLRRQGKIDAFEFLIGLVFGQMSALRLTLSAQTHCCTEPVSRQ